MSSRSTAAGMLRPLALPAVSAGLALAIMAPLLGRGFVLSYDMVFTPLAPLTAMDLGLDASLPRSVPADAIVSFAATVLPADIVQKLVLFAALAAGPLGAGSLVPANWLAILWPTGW